MFKGKFMYKVWNVALALMVSGSVSLSLNSIQSVEAAESERFGGGSGTEQDPYLVENAEHLNNVREELDKYFLQVADIDLSDYGEDEGWKPLGFFGDGVYEEFTGSYDGDGYTITNLRIYRPETDRVGLFGTVAEDGVVKNLGLEDVDVTGKSAVAALVGRLVSDHAASTDVAKVIKSYAAKGSVTAEGNVAGGLVGSCFSERTLVENSYADVTVSAQDVVGALVGSNWGGISYSYAAGDCPEHDGAAMGGLVGGNWGDIEIKSSYYNVEAAGQKETDRGIPKTAEEMMQKDTYEGWDFDDVWQIEEGESYPNLK